MLFAIFNGQFSICNSPMAIKFFCSCGKHLRAREALAGKRSVCPQCGQLVGVPSLQANHRGTVPAPMTPAEKGKLKPRDAIPISGPARLAAQALVEVGF